MSETFNKNINWYPGHMAKTKREIRDMLNLIDVVVCVVDARIPYSSSSLGLESMVEKKEKIMVLSKWDLCDKEETNKWIKKFESEGYTVITANLKDGSEHKKIISKIEELMIPINEKRHAKGLLDAKARVLVLGVPNVGKSTLINKISGKTKVNVGNKPGVTKSLSWIKVNKTIDLLDTPGLLLPKIEEKEVALNLASMTTIKEDILPTDEVAVHILNVLNDYYSEILFKNYGIKEVNKDDYVEVYYDIARHRGVSTKDEDDMFNRVSMMVINDIKSEKIRGITFDRFGK